MTIETKLHTELIGHVSISAGVYSQLTVANRAIENSADKNIDC